MWTDAIKIDDFILYYRIREVATYPYKVADFLIFLNGESQRIENLHLSYKDNFISKINNFLKINKYKMTAEYLEDLAKSYNRFIYFIRAQ